MSVAASPLTVAPVDTIRAAFPALARTQDGAPVAYFDGPGGTQVPRAVAEAMTDYLFHHNANTHWAFPTSEETDALLLAARGALGDLLGAPAGEIAFGANMTTLVFHLARAIGRTLAPGDEIVVTELDHHANVAPWQALAQERGAVLRWVPLDITTGTHADGAFARVIGGRTKVVAVGAASNALGTITDVAPICAMARAVGAISVVDAVHYAPHVLPDVHAMGADFVACSAYKFYGPHVGVLWGRHDAIAALDLPRLEPAPDTVPECLETGTQNHEGIVGAAAAVHWLASLARATGDDASRASPARRSRLAATYAALHERASRQCAALWDGLGALPGVTRLGPPPDAARTATISVRLPGEAAPIARALGRRGLFVSHGDFYATTVARRLGAEDHGLLRIGCVAYTADDEIVRLLDALGDLVR